MQTVLKRTDAEKLQALTERTEGKYDAFLYDCDGTLADNMQAHKDAYSKVCTAHGITLDQAIIDELAGWPTIAVAAEICKRYSAAFDHHSFASLKSQTFVDEFIAHTKPMPFVVDHLKAHAGRIKIGVVSGGRRSTVSKTLAVLGIAELIDVLVCADDTERGKPYPDPFLLAAQSLDVAPERCIVFEDGNPGVESAKAAGMDWVRVDQM